MKIFFTKFNDVLETFILLKKRIEQKISNIASLSGITTKTIQKESKVTSNILPDKFASIKTFNGNNISYSQRNDTDHIMYGIPMGLLSTYQGSLYLVVL